MGVAAASGPRSAAGGLSRGLAQSRGATYCGGPREHYALCARPTDASASIPARDAARLARADVALRAGSRPEGAGIVARRLQDTSWSVYCSKAYAEQHGIPKRLRRSTGIWSWAWKDR
jgi:hypothetical protein